MARKKLPGSNLSKKVDYHQAALVFPLANSMIPRLAAKLIEIK
jgi:hypothetical protein